MQHLARYAGNRYSGWVHPELELPDFLLEQPERAFELPGSDHVLDCEGRQIYRLRLRYKGRSCRCFSYLFTNRSWTRALRRTSALRIRRISETLSQHGIPSLEVLAAVKPKHQILDWDSFLIAEEITPACELPSSGRHLYRVHTPVELSSDLMVRLAEALAQFHKSSFFHGDLKSRHILVKTAADGVPNFVLVDLEKCRYLPWITPLAQDFLATRDLIQLLSSLEIGTDAQGFTELFVSTYLESLEIPPGRSNRRRRLLALYGPHGSFTQGKTVLQNVCGLLRGFAPKRMGVSDDQE